MEQYRCHFEARMLCAYKSHMSAAGDYLRVGDTEKLNWALEDALYFWMQSV